eukprot:14949469-Heterocapsa_arctica.AAC.1
MSGAPHRPRGLMHNIYAGWNNSTWGPGLPLVHALPPARPPAPAPKAQQGPATNAWFYYAR